MNDQNDWHGRFAASFDADGINDTIRRALASAGLDTGTGPMKGVTDTIRHALAQAGLGGAVQDAPARRDVIDVEAREVPASGARPAAEARPVPGARPARPGRHAPAPAPDEPVVPGRMVRRRFANAAGGRDYRLYVPATPAAGPMPLVMMLHGCTQTPEDFAAGTRMNELAEREGFIVAWPEQAKKANGSRCWNWFRAQDQSRDRGEPSILAGIAREIIASQPVDARRVFVAGLSAGAAMAVILGATHPDLFAAVGAHSGLPLGAAHDVPSALAAMKQGPKGRPTGVPGAAVPVIVFHGDRDGTVDIGNGSEIVRQAVAALGARAATEGGEGATAGRTHRRTVFVDAAGRPVVEDWVIHGAGHAWSGGSAQGSYTDPQGPDASAEMLRFFLSRDPGGRA